MSETEIPRRHSALVICNPTAGRKTSILSSTVQSLRQLGMDLDIQETQDVDHAEALCQTAIKDNPYDCIIAAGGDGTINQVANHLIGTSIPLGIIPTGTTNVLASEINLSPDPELIARTIVFGGVKSVFCGNLNGRIFLLMVSVGFDSGVVAGVSKGLKNIFGKGAYALVALKHLFSKTLTPLQVTVDGEKFNSTWAIISKSVYYAGKFKLAPEASLVRKEFVVTLFQGESIYETVRYLFSIGFGQGDFKGVAKVLSGDRISIEGNANEPVQLDGDCAGFLPISVSMVSEPLNLIMPSK
jgi:diacylglycerol kinase (ATP)